MARSGEDIFVADFVVVDLLDMAYLLAGGNASRQRKNSRYFPLLLEICQFVANAEVSSSIAVALAVVLRCFRKK